jgi:host factor-I protein
MSGTKADPLQTVFMNAASAEQADMSIFLVNGVRLRGVIVAEDPYTLLLAFRGSAQLVYKHAISSVSSESGLALRGTEPQAPNGG